VQVDPALIDTNHASNPGRWSELRELQKELGEAMMTLSETHRRVVTMFDIQGMPHGEIATIRDPKRSLPEEHRQEF
jgi:DNA-directed RNA polymerase specialized sigma24 family protein